MHIADDPDDAEARAVHANAGLQQVGGTQGPAGRLTPG